MSTDLLSQQLQEIDARKAEWDRLQPVAPDRLEKIHRKIRTEWNYNSNAIEGNRISFGETRALITQNLTPSGKSFEEVRDIQGHDRAITRVYDWVARKVDLSETAIRDLHTILLVEEHDTEAQTESGAKTKKRVHLGRYKQEPNFVTVGGQRVMYALPQDVPAQMHDLLTWYRAEVGKKDLHPILLTSVFHYRFTRIHPFDDGNGRLGRLLLNFILMEHGYAPAILAVSEREAYISALRAADADENALAQLSQFVADAELAALDLSCRGARGENVEDDTDLDKQVLMLKQQLKRSEEPLPKNTDTLRNCLQDSVFPLLARATQKLSEFDELFTNAEVCPLVDNMGGNHRKPEEIAHFLTTILNSRGKIDSIQVEFRWKGFKKGGVRVFDHSIMMQIYFSELKWSVTPKGIERMYQQRLGEEATREIVDILRRDVLNTISKYVNPQ